jgi:hypothetical protein
MDALLDFGLEVSQNKYLSTEDSDMNAILTISGHSVASVPGLATPDAAEVILVDCSSSMDWPATKIAAARRATCAAIDTLRDGVRFAVVEGTDTARLIYPPEPPLATVTSESRAEAKTAVRQLIAEGGTAIGPWLSLARDLLTEHSAAVRHVVLLTDGRNEHETPAELDAVLATCEGQFVCDARGIGDGYEPKELQRIALVLRGTADAVREEADLVEDFQEMMRSAMSKVVPDLRLRIRTLQGNRLRFVKQVFPTELDLTPHAVRLDERTTELSTGAWGDERREFHVCLTVDPAGLRLREDTQLAKVELMAVHAGVPDARPASAKPVSILVHLTDDAVQSTRVDAKVGHYTEHAELRRLVVAGCDAYDEDDLTKARDHWGRAVTLATALGNDRILRNLGRLVDIVDGEQGVVRLKDGIQLKDLHGAELSSVYSIQKPAIGLAPDDGPGGPGLGCPDCGRIWPSTAAFCMGCGRALNDCAEGAS